ncbi:unnamed protein product [Cylindrotheca closterium]|uniref:Uncharacterized protein n=1 Tax=Cylindrotheca closterium TaxID=2856 RepID=A0AAD2FR39_9STRA|nr:unnamed protein product [Cylindrotheca closterium]
MSSMIFEAMLATERLYDNSVGVFNDCLTSPKEEAVIANEDFVRHMLDQTTNKSTNIYSYDSDEEKVENDDLDDLVMMIQKRQRKDNGGQEEEKDEETPSLDGTNTTASSENGRLASRMSCNMEQLCAHEQYGLDICLFLFSPNSPLHSPDRQLCDHEDDHDPNPAQDDSVVQENDTNDNDESWFGIECGKMCGGINRAIEADEKTAQTAANSESSREDGSTTIDDSLGEFTYESVEEDDDEQQERGIVPPNALATYLMGLIAENTDEASGGGGGQEHHSKNLGLLECNDRSILSGEIKVPFKELPEPAGRCMTEPSDDDYLMLLQTDPKGTSFCTDDEMSDVDDAGDDESEDSEETDELCPRYPTQATRQALRSSLPPYVPQGEFSPRRQYDYSEHHLEPDGATILSGDEVSSAVESEFSKGNAQQESSNSHTHREADSNSNLENGGKTIYVEILTSADLVHDAGSVSSSLWSHRALLDDDDSILNEDSSWEDYREPDGTKFADIVKYQQQDNDHHATSSSSSFPAAAPTVNEILNDIMSDDDDGDEQEQEQDTTSTIVFSEPFDETQDNFRSSPRQQMRSGMMNDGAHATFELPHIHNQAYKPTQKPKTSLEKRLNLLERLKGLRDSDTHMLCACVQGCGDFADATFFEGAGDEASQEEEGGSTMEQLSLD